MQHPFPRRCRLDELRPSVHWAKHHANIGGSLIERRIRDFELLYVASGRLAVRIGDGEAFAAGPGTLLLLPSFALQRIRGEGYPATALIGIHFDFFDEVAIEAEHEIVFAAAAGDASAAASENASAPDASGSAFFARWPTDERGAPYFRTEYAPAPPAVLRFMEEAVAAHRRGGPSGRLACRGAMLQLLAELAELRRLPRAAAEAAPDLANAVRAAAAEMAAQPARPWTNRELAERLHVSEDHAIRLFRRVVGTTPRKHLQAARHREAKRLLTETDWKIERIALELGFSDLHSFSHTFRKLQGIPPREYRELSRLI